MEELQLWMSASLPKNDPMPSLVRNADSCSREPAGRQTFVEWITALIGGPRADFQDIRFRLSPQKTYRLR